MQTVGSQPSEGPAWSKAGTRGKPSQGRSGSSGDRGTESPRAPSLFPSGRPPHAIPGYLSPAAQPRHTHYSRTPSCPGRRRALSAAAPATTPTPGRGGPGAGTATAPVSGRHAPSRGSARKPDSLTAGSAAVYFRFPWARPGGLPATESRLGKPRVSRGRHLVPEEAPPRQARASSAW